MKKVKRLPDAEFEIMDFIWDQEPPVTTSLVMRHVGRARDWKIQTVVSLFARLTERGFLRVEKGGGRERQFYPAISREAYLAMETESLFTHLHKRSVPSLISSLHSDDLSDADLDDLAAWVQRLKEGRS